MADAEEKRAGFWYRLGGRLEKRPFVRQAIDDDADLTAFRQRPSFRLVLGLILLGVSYTIGWPAVAVFVTMAVYFGEPLLALGGPVAYGVSWGVWAVSMALIGVENVVYGRVFLRWLARVSTQRMLRRGPDSQKNPARETGGR